MVIQAPDELRHPHSDDPDWRESMWFCFQDPRHGFGGAIYYSYMPNVANPMGSWSFYVTTGMQSTPNQPAYVKRIEVPLPDADWDDLTIDGVVTYRRIEALKRWSITIRDGDRMQADIEADFHAGAWHYIDNVHPTPRYLAADRYHRPWRMRGEMRLDGVTYALDCTGDSDHSWGPRRWAPLYKSKYIAGQAGDRFAFQAFSGIAADGGVVPYGFVWDEGRMHAITDLEIAPDYGTDGIQRGLVMNIVDERTRLTRVVAESFCTYPAENADRWNNDCYATMRFGEDHVGSGILSFYWGREHYRAAFGR
jgi:hypothetical protein